VKINITTETEITGYGGMELMSLNYICRKPDLCNSAQGLTAGFQVAAAAAVFFCSIFFLIS
jgi:hypothetical protein